MANNKYISLRNAGGSQYELPAATSDTLGGVKIGSGVTVAADGTISVAAGTEDIELPIAAAINELKTYYDVKLGQQYYKKSDIDALLSLYATKGDAVDYPTLNTQLQAIYASIEDKELAISAALNDLNTRKQDNTQ